MHCIVWGVLISCMYHSPQLLPLQVCSALLRPELIPGMVSATAWASWSCLFLSVKSRRMKMCSQEDIRIPYVQQKVRTDRSLFLLFQCKKKCLEERQRKGGWADLGDLQVWQVRCWLRPFVFHLNYLHWGVSLPCLHLSYNGFYGLQSHWQTVIN